MHPWLHPPHARNRNGSGNRIARGRSRHGSGSRRFLLLTLRAHARLRKLPTVVILPQKPVHWRGFSSRHRFDVCSRSNTPTILSIPGARSEAGLCALHEAPSTRLALHLPRSSSLLVDIPFIDSSCTLRGTRSVDDDRVRLVRVGRDRQPSSSSSRACARCRRVLLAADSTKCGLRVACWPAGHGVLLREKLRDHATRDGTVVDSTAGRILLTPAASRFDLGDDSNSANPSGVSVGDDLTRRHGRSSFEPRTAPTTADTGRDRASPPC